MGLDKKKYLPSLDTILKKHLYILQEKFKIDMTYLNLMTPIQKENGIVHNIITEYEPGTRFLHADIVQTCDTM